ncbi:MAG: sugar transferase [candidate division Zixibacteria bacterium]|nr:sugar transferase [candidate division Zixibacteria bacterium]
MSVSTTTDNQPRMQTPDSVRAREPIRRLPARRIHRCERTGSLDSRTLVASRARRRRERTPRLLLSPQLVRALSGDVMDMALAALLAVTVLSSVTDNPAWLFFGPLGFAAVRWTIGRLTGARRLLGQVGLSHSLWSVLRFEIKASVGTLAAVYCLQPPIPPIMTGGLLLLNACVQVARWYLGTRLIAHERPGAQPVGAATRVFVIGTGPRARQAADILLDSLDKSFTILGFLDHSHDRLWSYRDIPLVGTPDQLRVKVGGGQVDAVVLAVEPDQLAATRPLIAESEQMGIPVCILPDIYTATIGQYNAGEIVGRSALILRATPESRVALLAKSVIDKLGAVVGIIVSAPIMLTCAALIKWESPGPILFKQVRAGLNGRPFQLYKFRTMCEDAERIKHRLQERNEMSGPVFKIRRDPRITRVGAILRKYSLDELPQFFNVLMGDMSLVGPRPPLPREVVGFDGWQRRKLSVKPGLTCLWQVNGRNEIDFEEWMKLDLRYIDTWSLSNDLRILVKTIPAVLKGSGM